MAEHAAALANLERAHGEFVAYLAFPVENRRDKAGVIQAFEFTFELFWKLFQKLAPDSGLEARTPREALQVGVKLRLIPDEDAPHWSLMLRDRNVTSHLYRADLADEVFTRVRDDYARCFAESLNRLRKR